MNLTSHSKRRGTGQELSSECKALEKWRRLIAFHDFPHFSVSVSWSPSCARDGKVRNRIIFFGYYVDYEVIVSTHSSLVKEEDLCWQRRRKAFRKHSHYFSSVTYTIMSSDNDADGLFDDIQCLVVSHIILIVYILSYYLF